VNHAQESMPDVELSKYLVQVSSASVRGIISHWDKKSVEYQGYDSYSSDASTELQQKIGQCL